MPGKTGGRQENHRTGRLPSVMSRWRCLQVSCQGSSYPVSSVTSAPLALTDLLFHSCSLPARHDPLALEESRPSGGSEHLARSARSGLIADHLKPDTRQAGDQLADIPGTADSGSIRLASARRPTSLTMVRDGLATTRSFAHERRFHGQVPRTPVGAVPLRALRSPLTGLVALMS
jgi:hypothetical protein